MTIALESLLPNPKLVPEDVQHKASGIPLTESSLIALLANERVQFVRVVTRTFPKFRRGSPFRPRSVVSICVRTGTIGADYLSVVRAQQAREGIFHLAKLQTRCRPARLWNGRGQHVAGNRHLVRHRDNGLFYLVLYPRTNALGTPLESARLFFTADELQPVDALEVKRWRVVSKGSNFPKTKKDIPWRTPCLGSITSITIAGTPYALVGTRSKPMCAAKRKTAAKPGRVSKRVSKKQKSNAAAVRLQEPLPDPEIGMLQEQREIKEAESVMPHPGPTIERRIQALELRTVKAGSGGLGRLAVAVNEAARRGQVVGMFLEGGNYVICLDRSV